MCSQNMIKVATRSKSPVRKLTNLQIDTDIKRNTPYPYQTSTPLSQPNHRFSTFHLKTDSDLTPQLT